MIHPRLAPARLSGVTDGRLTSYLVASATFLVDLVTKTWVVATLSTGEPRKVIGSLLKFHYARNSGAAFSLGTGSTLIFTFIATAVAIAIVFYAKQVRNRVWATAFGLVLGGALGNLADRIFRTPGAFRGHVVDWIELPHWPIFNIADSAIVVAACLIVLLSLRGVGLREASSIGNRGEASE